MEKVIAREKPDGILLSFGGQTALNCGVALAKSGVAGQARRARPGHARRARSRTPRTASSSTPGWPRSASNRPRGVAATTIEEGLRVAREIGYPVMARVAYALGGRGSGLSAERDRAPRSPEEGLRPRPPGPDRGVSRGLERGRVRGRPRRGRQLRHGLQHGELRPDGHPYGREHRHRPVADPDQRRVPPLREIAIKAVRHLGIVGECNIQYALDPHDGDYRIIEVNARLSRSSALASKATGYPLAFVAAKLALGQPLPGLLNSITKKTTACFEPALDYLVVKIPRWDLKKFRRVSKKIGSEMKSVGEVMAIGRSFEEALQKATRMLQIGVYGVVGNESYSFEDLEKELRHPTDERLFGVAEALKKG